MVTIIIFGVICGLIVMLKSFDDYAGWLENVFNGLFGFFLGGLLGVVIGFVIAILLPMDKYTKTYSYNIENLQDNNTTGINYRLGTGYIKGEMKYFMYIKDGDVYRLYPVDYDKAVVKYIGVDNVPTIDISEIQGTDSWLNYFSYDFDLGEKNCVINVHKGTIKNDFNLDSK